MAPLNANHNKNAFIDNFLAYISSDSVNESDDSIDKQTQNEKIIKTDKKNADQSPPIFDNSYLDYQQIQNHNKKMNTKKQYDSMYLGGRGSCNENNNTMSQISSLVQNYAESIENLNFNNKGVKIHRGSVSEFTTKRNDSVFESQDQLNDTKDTNHMNGTDYESAMEITSRKNDAFGKKKSLPNIVFRNHRQSLDMAPVVNKRKFSLGSVKVRLLSCHCCVCFNNF